jgi:hypothetical protein
VTKWAQIILALTFAAAAAAAICLVLSGDEWARWTAFVLAVIAAIGKIFNPTLRQMTFSGFRLGGGDAGGLQ